MPVVTSTPKNLRPFLFHRLHLEDWSDGKPQVVGDCPFCRAEGKFTIQVETGLWRCFRCNEGTDKGKVIQGGNAKTFLEKLWEHSEEDEVLLKKLAQDRGLLSWETLKAWGVRIHPLTGEFVVPGYDAHGKLCQLYRYVKTDKGMRLMATSEMGHGLFMPSNYNAEKEEAACCEGPWDGMALWEMLRSTREDDGEYKLTAAEDKSLMANINVLAVPGCSTFYDYWTPVFAGKKTTLLFDNDHPRDNNGREVPPAAYEGMRRVTQTLLGAKEPPISVSYLKWAEGGYDSSLKSGFDVRDWLTGVKTHKERIPYLIGLLDKIEDVPAEWKEGVKPRQDPHQKVEIQPLSCTQWSEVVNAWRKAMKWRRGLEDVLAVSVAVCLSTEQSGNSQLFLQIIGNAGTGKTRICDALLVSKHCYPLEHLSGFHSGWKGDGGEDYSLLARVNRKTMVTPEGDVLMSGPKFIEIMSQQRRIFDGTSGASYKNKKEDTRYTGLRTPWIIAGTPALMDTDQSRLGDRFLKIWVDQPDESEEYDILRKVCYSSLNSVKVTSNCSVDTHISPEMALAYRLTGGYIDYLRNNAERLLNSIDTNDDVVVEQVPHLARFTACMRARPNMDPKKKDTESFKELPTRLAEQFSRLAACLTVTIGHDKIDDEVMRIVKVVAFGTSVGRVLNLSKYLYRSEDGREIAELARYTHQTEDDVEKLMRFSKKIGIAESFSKPVVNGMPSRQRWRLTPKLRKLYQKVMED